VAGRCSLVRLCACVGRTGRGQRPGLYWLPLLATAARVSRHRTPTALLRRGLARSCDGGWRARAAPLTGRPAGLIAAAGRPREVEACMRAWSLCRQTSSACAAPSQRPPWSRRWCRLGRLSGPTDPRSERRRWGRWGRGHCRRMHRRCWRRCTARRPRRPPPPATMPRSSWGCPQRPCPIGSSSGVGATPMLPGYVSRARPSRALAAHQEGWSTQGRVGPTSRQVPLTFVPPSPFAAPGMAQSPPLRGPPAVFSAGYTSALCPPRSHARCVLTPCAADHRQCQRQRPRLARPRLASPPPLPRTAPA
jgi:hypothetical protein